MRDVEVRTVRPASWWSLVLENGEAFDFSHIKFAFPPSSALRLKGFQPHPEAAPQPDTYLDNVKKVL